MKTIATFWRTDDAHLLRLRLEAAGFHAVLQDENITQIHPWRASAIGGVRLQVDESDFEAIRKFLSDNSDGTPALHPASDPDSLKCCSCQTPIPGGHSRCPACGWSYEDVPEGWQSGPDLPHPKE